MDSDSIWSISETLWAGADPRKLTLSPLEKGCSQTTTTAAPTSTDTLLEQELAMAVRARHYNRGRITAVIETADNESLDKGPTATPARERAETTRKPQGRVAAIGRARGRGKQNKQEKVAQILRHRQTTMSMAYQRRERHRERESNSTGAAQRCAGMCRPFVSGTVCWV